MGDTSALNMLSVALADRLSVALIEGVAESDPTQAGVVKTGKLQTNPTRGKVNITVLFGDRDWRNELYRGMPGGAEVSPYEIGGSVWEWERFVIRLKLFFNTQGMTQAEAQEAAGVVYSRAKNAIRTMALPGTDSFGERPRLVQVHDGYIEHKGGPPKTWLFDGELRVEFLCVHEPSG